MTDAAGDRPQDVGRRHTRRGSPSVETIELLERYRAAMRVELAGLLEELGAAGQLSAFDVHRPPLDKRRAIWDLAVKLARELAAESGAGELGGPRAGESSRRLKPAPRLTVAARRALGG